MPAPRTPAIENPISYQPLKNGILIEQDETLKDLVKQLKKAVRFVAVRGAEGSGKSVFLNKQLIPFLINEQPDDEHDTENEWRAVAFSPLINPIGALARALTQPGILRASGNIETSFYQEAEKILRSGSNGLINLYEKAAERSINETGKPFKLLIVVDELKQLFELHDQLIQSELLEYAYLHDHFQPGDDELFFHLLLKAIQSDLQIYVVFSISNTSFSRLNNYHGWPEVISLNRFYLPELSAEKVINALSRSATEDENMETHPVANKIYHELIDLYRKKRQGNSIARLNTILALLTRKHYSSKKEFASPEKLGSKDTKSKTASDYDDYFSEIERIYEQINCAEHEIDYLCEEVIYKLKSGDRLLVERLFKAISVKDPSPAKVVQGNPCKFSTLVDICFRDGEEYPELRSIVNSSGIPDVDKKSEHLANLIQCFRFTSPNLPNLIEIIHPQPVSDDNKDLISDDTIIDIGKGNLVKHWTLFREWIEEERSNHGFYRIISEEAMIAEANLAVADEKVSTEEEKFPRYSMLKARWIFFVKSFLEVLAEKSEVADHSVVNYRGNQLMKEGKIEIAKEQLSETMPSSDWIMRHAATKIKSGKVSITDQLLVARKLSAHSLNKVTEYFLESKAYREQVRLDEQKNSLRKRRNSRIFAWTVLMAFASAMLFIALGFYYRNQAKIAESNLELLEFIDKLDEVNLLASSAYQGGGLRELKVIVGRDEDITSKGIVIDSLASWGKLNLQIIADDELHHNSARLAMLQIDSLGKRRYAADSARLVTLSGHVLANVNSLSGNDRSVYQYPAVYKSLIQTGRAIRAEIRGAGRVFSRRQSGFLYRSPNKIQTVVSNPRVKGQFVVGDAGGNVQLFVEDTVRFDKLNPINEGISTMAYTLDGEELYVASYAGEIYRYWPLSSDLQPTSPRGYATNLEPIKIKKRNDRGGRKIAILSIHVTASKDHLLIQDDVGFSLIRIKDGEYLIEKYIDLTGKVKSLSSVASNVDGSKFIVGGSDASAVISLQFRSVGRSSRASVDVNIIDHLGVSISEIAFKKPEKADATDQQIALGTVSGQIVLTELNTFESFGNQVIAHDDENFSNFFSKEESTYQSTITHLTFNQVGNNQLISTSIDGSIWMLNLDLIPQRPVYTFNNNEPDSAWDHLMLSTGDGVDGACLVNKDQLITIEYNGIRTWRTNWESLRQDVLKDLMSYQMESEE